MIELYRADFFEKYKDIESGSVSMIFADIPYNLTHAEFDKNEWSLYKMWEAFNALLKPNGVIIMTATEPFNVDLINSNRKEFRYSWIWEKNKSSGFLNAKKMPLKSHELVLVWYKKLPTYNPQLTKSGRHTYPGHGESSVLYGNDSKIIIERNISATLRYPKSILKIDTVPNDITKRLKRLRHPTEKPVELLEYMIKTYTNEGDLVLDPCMGTGASMIAAQNLNRRGIGIELDTDYFHTALFRLHKETTNE